jgi:hypothetical protein
VIDVLHGDALEILPGLALDPARTVVVTDPPWPNEVGLAGGGTAAEETWRRIAGVLPLVADRLVLWLSALTDARLFVSHVPASLPWATVCWLKYIPPGYRGCFMSGDVAYVFGKMRIPEGAHCLSSETKSVSTAATRAMRRGIEHPCPRSLAHARRLLRWYAAKADTIVDPFCGSGTTLVAAAELGLNAIGIDVDERWCDQARERVRLTQEPLPGLEVRS